MQHCMGKKQSRFNGMELLNMTEQNTNEEWIVTGQSTAWDEKGVLVGKYIRVKTDVGVHKSNVYVLRKEDGTELGVWGSTVIDGRFEEIPQRSLVSIEYAGDKTPRNGGKPYKEFAIKYIPPKGTLHDPFENQEVPDEFLQEE